MCCPTRTLNDAEPTAHDTPALNDLGYFSEELRQYIQKERQHRDRANMRYAIANIPTDTRWGPTPVMANYLCVDHIPLRMSLVGLVKRMLFFTKDGEPVLRPCIGIEPCTTLDLTAAQRVLGTNAAPAYVHSNTTIYARKNMSSRKPGSTIFTANVFHDVFDNTKGAHMERISAAAIMPGDIVHVEVKLLRQQEVGNYKNKIWDEWETAFELSRIELVFAKPDNPPKMTTALDAFRVPSP
ncbi:hypothetical protein A0H81_09549 [Grifola frondosa]|uniref:Uncharacterized protein n=1 Tax=Grifola frondosa TaxID=5627 RepID=A0A1C7M1C9_GRIFR|nr:hypothetical protein A0H81_09549 [Grifola frondosa]